MEELLLDIDLSIPEDVTKYSYVCVCVCVCFCSLFDIDNEGWLMTFQALLAFRGKLPDKIRRQCPPIFKNKQHHWDHSGSKWKRKTSSTKWGSESVTTLSTKYVLVRGMVFSTCHHKNYDFEGDCNQSRVKIHITILITVLILRSSSDIYECAKLLLINYPSYGDTIILYKYLIFTAPFIF